ncbi:uncharacterized protein RCC_03074 [Ramularia collo-cygni]|uniref:Borealin N-terminal domain-containing protein n=1 Tax=Ramularia collo-cygni TaxID=112498 RepID=A0A2D3UPG4_9PEZI|nr:uncharacterized protein RCC_03074 [Ramularia collo-cygni]CZT17241.1 uncharacterized protein RCC_03074 [Ramularia collo-cygni]
MESNTITLAQRQAIIDNFQLEIAERARKLRSQYNLQAQGLRARLEMRVNRIPQALRKRNIGELVEEHENRLRPAPPPPMAMPVASGPTQPALQPAIRSRQAQAAKRKSDEMSTLSSEGADKENEELPVPKKRTKATTTTATANSKATRALPPVRKAALPGTTNPAGVLSPRSNNSRTLPAPPAPFKSSNLSPEKKTIPRSGAVSRTGNASRAGARTATKGAASSENGRSSEASAGSNGTTIVKGKKAPAKKTTTAPSTMATKAAAARKAAASTTAAVGRTLRKRN